MLNVPTAKKQLNSLQSFRGLAAILGSICFSTNLLRKLYGLMISKEAKLIIFKFKIISIFQKPFSLSSLLIVITAIALKICFAIYSYIEIALSSKFRLELTNIKLS
jgi:hypothetical protein